MLDGDPVGYWCPTYKDLFEVWREVKEVVREITTFKSETVNQIEVMTGGKMDFWSMQDPDSGRGRMYKRAIIDEAEKAMYFKQCFDQTIRPTLIDLKGDVWVFSTPKGKRTYFQELYERKDKYENWMSWQKGTKENPHIPPEEIEEARQQLDKITFLQEFEGESIDYSGMAFAHAFREGKHLAELQADDLEPFYLSFDFNHAPVTCTMWQHHEEKIRGLREFESSIGLPDLCEQIKSVLGELVHNTFLTGDRSGWNKTELFDGNRTAYDIIQQNLDVTQYQIDAPKINPNMLKSRELVNGILEHYPDFKIDSRYCPKLIFDLKFVEADRDHKIVKDRNKTEGKADYMDNFRYYLNTYHQEFIRV